MVWYGPQPNTAKVIAPELLPRLRHERPVGSTTRLLMTGAFLPPEAEGARLNRAFLFLKRDSVATQAQLLSGGQTGCGLHSYEALWSTELPCARGRGALSGGARAVGA